MSKQKSDIYEITSITELHRLLGLPKPKHPLVSVINLEEVVFKESLIWEHFTTSFYTVALKQGETGKLKYGQKTYDFDEGILTFTSPRQVFSIANSKDINITGYTLAFHPDFLQQHSLIKKIKDFGFFSYATNEALFLSDHEEQILISLLQSIEQEYNSSIDTFSQNVILTNIELLMVYADRYYNRQFITRKNQSHDLLTKVETILSEYYDYSQLENSGLPTVQNLANQLNVSPSYLSDILKNFTGQTAQQHIHNKLLDKSKELLSTTKLSVSEISYQLGFEYSQSFNKFFKRIIPLIPFSFIVWYPGVIYHPLN